MFLFFIGEFRFDIVEMTAYWICESCLTFHFFPVPNFHFYLHTAGLVFETLLKVPKIMSRHEIEFIMKMFFYIFISF